RGGTEPADTARGRQRPTQARRGYPPERAGPSGFRLRPRRSLPSGRDLRPLFRPGRAARGRLVTLRILLVEDEDPKRLHVCRLIEAVSDEIEVTVAKSVNSALDALEDRTPD